jgi:ferredoxin
VGSCGTCVLILVQGAENVPPPTEDELETVRMCTDADARLGCQLVVNGDIVVTHLE